MSLRHVRKRVSEVGGGQASGGWQRVVGYNHSRFLCVVRLSIVSKGLAYSTGWPLKTSQSGGGPINISAGQSQTVVHKRDGTATN